MIAVAYPYRRARRLSRISWSQYPRAPAPETVKAKIFVNGADAPFVKREQYDALKKDFDAPKADYRVIEYPGAVHAFTKPEAAELGKKFDLPTPRWIRKRRPRRPHPIFRIAVQ